MNDYYQVVVCGSITPFGSSRGAVWRESFPVAGAFDDDLVAGVGQAIQHAVAQDGVIEETQPFLCSFLVA